MTTQRISKDREEYQVLIGGPYDDLKDQTNIVPLLGLTDGTLPVTGGAYVYSHSEHIGAETHMIYFWKPGS
jgi:hypothetical protein